MFDDDNYLNGLEPGMYRANFPMRSSDPDFYPSYPDRDGGYCLAWNGLWCDSLAFLDQSPPTPPHYYIFRAWYHAKHACNIENKDISIYPNNECLNVRFGRLSEPNGEENCKLNYIWNLRVKSRPCMIKNAKLDELELYQICGADDAFLCTKVSIIEKQEILEADRAYHKKMKKEL